MSDMVNGNGGPPPSPVMPVDFEEVANQLAIAIRMAGARAAMVDDPREFKELAEGALKFAQAIVVLNPELDASGIPLEHQTEMERLRLDGQERLERARAQAAAPTPSKRRRLTMRRSDGSTANIDVEEG